MSLNLNLMLQLSIRIFFKEHLIDSHVKSGNHFLWITDKLSVQVSIKCLQMTTVDAKEWCLQDVNLWKANIQLDSAT